MTDTPPPTRRSSGWKVGRLLGASVVVQPTTLILVALIGYLMWDRNGASADAGSVIEALLLVLALVASIFLHELAHAYAARRFGRRVHEIVLTLFGGHTSFDSKGISPLASGVTAAVGPASNVAIGAACLGAAALAGPGDAASVLGWIGFVNVALAIFNALPGLPMDGGRVLEAIVWGATGRRAPGTVTAAWVGRGVAIAVPVWVVGTSLAAGTPPGLLSLVWSVLIAGMLWAASSQSLRMVRVMRRTEAMRARVLMRPAFGLDYESTVAAALAHADAEPDAHVVVTGADGAAAGHFALAAAIAVPEASRGATALTAVMRPVPRGAELGVEAEGDVLVENVREWWGRTDALVVTDDGAIVGVVVMEDVVRALGGGR